MQAVVATQETLSARAAGWSAKMRNADTGPLNIAAEVMAVVDQWDAYKAEAGGLSAELWLRKVFRHGNGVAWWRERAEAVEILGEAVRRRLHHNAARYLAHEVPESMRKDLLYAAMVHAQKQGTPTCLDTVKRMYAKALGRKPQKTAKVCDECERLRALLVSHGVDPDVK